LVNQDFNKKRRVEFHEDKATQSKWKNISAEIRRRQLVIVYQLKIEFVHRIEGTSKYDSENLFLQ
jgi:hypothetical protein